MKEYVRNIILTLLTLEARAVLAKYKPKIVVITGSVGKTSTKDATFTALKGTHFVRKSEKSYNSDIGVPLTVLGVPNGWSNIFVWFQNLLKGITLLVTSAPYPKWLVLELGADRPGDISRALSWIKPDIVVTTTFPEVPVHVEFYESPQAVAEEELFPLSRLSQDGTAIINHNDAFARDANLPEGVQCITYGTEKEADVRGMRYRITSSKGQPTGISFDISYKEEKAHVVLSGVLGRGHMQAVLAGVSSALAAGVSLEAAAAAFTAHTFPPSRLRIISGKKDSTIIDDSYNASPVAVAEALDVLKHAPTTGKRIAVLGDMFELGKFSIEEHARMGALSFETADILVTVGVRARGIAEKARALGMTESRVHTFDKAEQATSFLKPFIGPGDIVLIKGSQGMRMERIVKALMENPDTAPQLLARQDPEWLARA